MAGRTEADILDEPAARSLRGHREPGRPSLEHLAFPAAVALAAMWALFQTFWQLTFARAEADEPTYAISAWYYIHGDHHAVPATIASSTVDAFEHPPLARLLFGLAQLPLGHPSIYADRFVAGLSTLGAAALIGWWLARSVNRWTGLVAAVLVAVLPMRAGATDFSIDRYGILDPVAEFFMVASVVAAWSWWRGGRRGGWPAAVATGVATGLAAGAKENGFLGVVGPVVLIIGVAAWSDLRTLVIRSTQAVVAGALAVGAFLATYLPMPHAGADLRYLIRFQTHQSGAGHVIGFAGRVSAHPPGWAFLWFAGHSLGSVTVVATLASVGFALLVRPGPLVAWCVAALAGPLLFHIGFAHVVLPYYWVMWMPAYVALVAVGLNGLVQGMRRINLTPAVGRIPATAGLVALVSVSGLYSYRLATIRLDGPAALAQVVRTNHLSGGIALFGVYSWETYGESLPGPVTSGVPSALAAYRTVAVSTPRCRDPLSSEELALLRINLASGALQPVYADHRVNVYEANASLALPSSAQTAAQPAEPISYKC